MSNVKKIIKNSDIYVNDTLIKNPAITIQEGAVVRLVRQKRIEENLTILYEDNELIAVDKPVSMLSSGRDGDEDESLHKKVDRYLKKKSHNRCGAVVVHRLDRKVSGVLLFAKSFSIEKMLEERWVEYEKRYHALVERAPLDNHGTIESYLTEDANYKVHTGEKRENSKLAITHYKVVKRSTKAALLDITLGTGRKNQIRAQLAEIGSPITGDVKYSATTNIIGRIGLHAYSFKLTNPVTGKMINIVSPTPKRFFLV